MLTYHSRSGVKYSPGTPIRALATIIESSEYDTFCDVLEKYPSMLAELNTPNPDVRYRTPLNQAVQLLLETGSERKKEAYLNMINVMLRKGANPNITSLSGATIYSYLATVPELRKILSNNGLDSPGAPIAPKSIFRTDDPGIR